MQPLRPFPLLKMEPVQEWNSMLELFLGRELRILQDNSFY
jgi:hypothetical protein